jgi:alpha-L-fucosidase
VYTWPGAGTALHLTARAPFTITGARVLGSTQKVTWQAVGDGYDITPSGNATNPIATVIQLDYTSSTKPVGTGTGLTAQYWDNATFTGTPKVTRVDPALNFAWRFSGSPDPAIPADNFSARWTGTIQPRSTEAYTLTTLSDDAVQVWLDGKLVIDNATPHSAALNTATVNLQAGHRYPIRIDYTERTGEAYLKLFWSGPDQGQMIVPTSQLSPT